MFNILDPLDKLTKSLPPHFFRHLIVKLNEAYERAYRSLEDIPPAMLKAALSDARYLLGAVAVREAALAFSSEGIDVKFRATRKQTHTYVEIFTPTLTITPHRVNFPSEFPRPAVYRTDHALENQHYLIQSLFPAACGVPYVYLLHGPSDLDPSRLGFVQFGLPRPHSESFISVKDIYMALEFAREKTLLTMETRPEAVPAEVTPILKPRESTLAK